MITINTIIVIIIIVASRDDSGLVRKIMTKLVVIIMK